MLLKLYDLKKKISNKYLPPSSSNTGALELASCLSEESESFSIASFGTLLAEAAA